MVDGTMRPGGSDWPRRPSGRAVPPFVACSNLVDGEMHGNAAASTVQ